MKGVKQLICMLLMLVILGSVVSLALAANIEQRIPTCPSCSRKVVTIPKDLEISELKGSSAYFKALQVFNSKDALKLREYLKDMNLKPLYDKAVVQIAKYKGVSTEVVKIPLKGKKDGMLIYVKNKYGEATVVGILDKQSDKIKVYYYDNGRLVVLTKPIQTLKWWIDACSICTAVVSELCSEAIGVDCIELCGGICWELFEIPPALAICFVVCGVACELGINWLCDQTANAACEALEFC